MPVLTMVAPALPTLVAARFAESVAIADELEASVGAGAESLEASVAEVEATSVLDGTESSVGVTSLLDGTESSVELLETGTGGGAESDDSQESQTVTLDGTETSGLE